MPPPKSTQTDTANTTLHATAQLLTFQPGLYAIDFAAARSVPTDTGLRLPCVRLEPVPPASANPGRAFVSVLADGGWLSQGSEPGFVRVTDGQAGVMLTIYKAGHDMAAPELRIRLLPEPRRGAPPTPATATAASARGSFTQMAHVQGRGDVRAPAGEWIGQAGSGVPIEGFSLTALEEAGAEDPARALEYQAILGDQWNTPWMRAGQFCGSRGMALPILGVRVRLTGAAAERHECQVWGSFVGESDPLGPIGDGEACTAGGKVMEALRVALVLRHQEAAATAKTSSTPPDARPTRGTRSAALAAPATQPQEPAPETKDPSGAKSIRPKRSTQRPTRR